MERLKQLGYCAKAISNYRGTWNTFVRFVRQSDAPNRFSVEAVERYLVHRGLPGPGAESLSASQRHIRSAMRILTEFALHGCFQRRRNMPQKTPLAAPWQTAPRWLRAVLPRGAAHGTAEPAQCDGAMFDGSCASLSRVACNRLAKSMRRFFRALSGCSLNCNPKPLHRLFPLCGLFCDTFASRGWSMRQLIDQVPKVRVYQGERLPTIWTPEDVQKLLSAVDRTSPIGKRDYAILLLAMRLGLRAGDIREMRLDQLDWDQSRIHVVQGKTGVPLELPLTEEVGEAIIDYLRHGRPASLSSRGLLAAECPFRAVWSRQQSAFDHHLLSSQGRHRVAGAESAWTAFPSAYVGQPPPGGRRAARHDCRHLGAPRTGDDPVVSADRCKRPTPCRT